jgi:hypothetical protein
LQVTRTLYTDAFRGKKVNQSRAADEYDALLQLQEALQINVAGRQAFRKFRIRFHALDMKVEDLAGGFFEDPFLTRQGMLFEPNDFANKFRKAPPIGPFKVRRKFRSHAATTSSFKYRTQAFLRSVDRSKANHRMSGPAGAGFAHARVRNRGYRFKKKGGLKD